MKKMINGVIYEMTAEEIEEMEKQNTIHQAIAAAQPLSAEEVMRLALRQQVNSLSIDDATASRMADYFPELRQDGSLIPAGTRINHRGSLYRAAVDLWDTAENSPDNAPTLWEAVQYRSGYRVIPAVITATLAFSKGDCGWWGEHLYRSLIDNNVWAPDAYPAGWEEVV